MTNRWLMIFTSEFVSGGGYGLELFGLVRDYCTDNSYMDRYGILYFGCSTHITPSAHLQILYCTTAYVSSLV